MKARQILYQARMGATIYRRLRNTDLVLLSPRAIQPCYAIFILVLFSSLSLHVSFVTMRATDNFKSTYGSRNGEMQGWYTSAGQAGCV